MVLLIEDDEDDYLLTRELFEEFEWAEHYELVWRKSFEEGLEAFRRGNYALCLLDYRLGAHTGLEFLREAGKRVGMTPVILLTGEGNREVDLKAMELGAVDYLVKGEFGAGLLERSIRYGVERHRLLRAQSVLAAENARLYKKAQRAVEIRDEVHRIVVHDLRNPLSTMGLAVQLMERLLSGEVDKETFRDQLETQRLCIRQMNRLIEDLLDVARIESGQLALSRGGVSVGTLLEGALVPHRIQAADRAVRIEAVVPEERLIVDVDQRRIQQVLANLIGNALKFTPAGGTIEVRAEAGDDGIWVQVSDTGCGVPAEQLPHLFDRFWQAEQGAYGGAGLGLAICQGIVEAHGGEIHVESVEGEGTMFRFRLQKYDEEMG